ncbi:MAG TPA: hypothetical protein VFZ61_16415 [Polyangiales bacterium]
MVMRTRSWWLLAAVALGACATEPRCKPIEHCDVREAACQAAALAQASCLRGRDEAQDPVQVEVVSEQEYEDELLRELEANPETEAETQVRRGLALFGLAQEANDPAEEARGQAAGLGGYFDPEDGRVVMIDHGVGLDGAGITTTLVHEMVHALQHRAGDLGIAEDARTYDEDSASRALIEGEATIWTDEATAEGWEVPFRDLDYAHSLRGYRGRSRSWIQQKPSPIESAYAAFSYAFGASYLWPLVQREGAAAVADAFADPPRSSYAVLEADPWRPEQRPNDLGESAVPELRLMLVGTLHLGSFLFETFSNLWEPTIELEPWFPEEDEFVADTFAVFTDEEGGVLASWRVRLSASQDAEAVAAEVAELNPDLRVGFEDQDIWLMAAENEALIEALPEELSWVAAPEVDFPFGQETDERARRRILCPLRTE